MDTSRKNFDVILPLIRNFDVSIDGFPKIDSAFSTIKIPFSSDIIDDAFIQHIDTSPVMLGSPFALTFDVEEFGLIAKEKLSLVLSLMNKFEILANASSIEYLSHTLNITPVSIWNYLRERLPAQFEMSTGTVRIITDATVGMWRMLFNWDYDDNVVPVLVTMAYWDDKYLSDLDVKEGEEYV